MFSRLAGYVVFGVVGWWAWTGPIHDWRTVSDAEQLDVNATEMARCLRGKAYVAGSTGNSTPDPEGACARELNMYRHEGRWYSYASPRPSSSARRS